MPGTLLLDDLHDSISQQLGDYASSLGSAVQGAQQAIAPVPLIPTPQAPDPNAILQELQQHAAAVAQAAQEQAQPAVQVLGQGVGGAVTQLGGAKDAVTQQLLQHAQDVASGAQDVNQQLQNHVQTVLGAATPSEPGGVQSLTKPAQAPSPVLGAPSGDQNAPPVLGATTGAVSQSAQPADTTAAAPSGMGPIDSSSPSAFARSIAPYAQYAATKLGIDPTWVAAMAGSESNYGKAQGNELFGVKALPGQPGTTMMTHEGEYGGSQMNQTFASYATPLDAVNAWVDLIKNHYPGAVNAQDLPSFVHGLRQGGYFTAAEPEYLGIVKGIGDRIGPDVQAGLQAVGIAPKGPSVATTPPVTTAQARAADLGYTDVSQFGDKQLSADEAYAACGPAAAVRFAERFGRNPTLREATDLAKQVGWTSSGGMAGITSEQQLLKNMGVDTHIVAPDWLAIAKEAQTGNPVTISTPGHYYFADGYNPETGAFHVGQSGLDLKNGAEWMTPQQMENLMGKAQGALFADNPNVPAKGASPTALGGTAAGATQNAPITMGANQPARAPLVVEDQTPTPIRAAQDVLGAAGEAASQLGTTAQDLLARAQELNRVQPGTEAIKAVTPVLGQAQQSASSAVNQVASDVQQAAQGVLGAAQDVNRLTPGTTAVNAAAPVLGAAASDLGTGAQRAVQDLGDSGAANALLRQGRTPAEQAEFERQQGEVLGGIAAQANAPAPSLNAGDVARNAWDLVVNSSPGLPGVSLQDYQHASTVKNDWIEQNNPAKDVLLLGGLTTMIAQQVTDPYALTMFGFTGGAGGVAGEAAGEAATAATANRLGQQGAAFVGRVANKLVDGSIVGGVQNALYAAEQPDASPESVFTALWQGAALGSAAEGGTAALTPVARRIGQAIIDQAPRLRPAVAEFARSETGAAGRPSDVAAVRDEQAGRAAPELATPAEGAAAEPAGRMFHYTASGDFNEFRTGDRGAVYLAETPMQALAGAEAGYRENVRRSAGIPTALREESGRLLRVDVAPETRVFQDMWPDRMSATEHDAVQAQFDQAKIGQSRDVQQAVDQLRSLSVGRAGSIQGDAIVYRDPPRALSHVSAERPAMQTALRLIGADATQVADEAGRSLAVLDPSKLNIAGRAPAQANVPFSLNVGGAVAGGVAGNVATPENATPEERARNIALGAGAGLLGTSALTRALERRRTGPEAGGGGVRPPDTGFRAPVTPDDLNVRAISQEEARQLVGPAYDPSTRTTTRPPEEGEPGEPTGIPGVTRRTVQGAEPPATPAGTSLSDVHSNPHLLNEAGPGETPMTMDERLAHQDTLEQRYQANQDRLAAIDEQLRNPNAKPERPPWGAGWTNDQLVSIAKAHGQSAYEPLWWEKAGLESGSGEVRENVGEGGFRNPNATREPTPQELRAERNQLAVDQRDLEAAGEQQATAPDNARFVRRQQSAAGLPFAGSEESAPHGPHATEGTNGTPGSLAEDLVTRNGTKDYGNPLQEGPGEVVGTRGGVTGTGINDINAEGARPGPPSEATLRRMPNLDAMLKGEMPEVRAQIQRAAEDNPELMDAYQQGRISRDSVMTDLATKVGMSKAEWLKTPVGKGFSTPELAALQAAAIDAQKQSEKLATDILAKGGVEALTPEEVAHSVSTLVDNARLLAVARGGRASAGRSLNVLKERIDATMARGITASNDRIAATRLANQAKAAVKRATQHLEQNRQLDAEQKTAVASARAQGAPKGIIDRIAEAYDQLDRYQAMTLHEKADDFNALKAQRDALAAKRQAAVREPPQELLSALQAELKAERDNFAKRKDTWETMAFWDSKANENVAQKRNAFRGGLYIEQYRKSADLAAKSAEADAKRAFDLESKRRSLQNQKASALLEAVGGQAPTRELLSNYVQAINDPDPMAAAKFIKGLQQPGAWERSQIIRIAGLLSSTATHAVNMTGNVVNAALEIPTHALTIGYDAARASITGGKRQAYAEELGPMAAAYGGGFLSAFPRAIKILQTGVSPQDAAELSARKLMRPGFASGSGKVDAAIEGPLRALQAEDELFRGGGFAMQANRVATRQAYEEGFRGRQLAGRAANIIANLENYPELYTEANKATLRMLYQERRTVPMPMAMGNTIGSDISRGAISQILPFIKTPANITAQGFGMSPLGLLSVGEAVANRRNLRPEQLGQQTLLTEQRLARATIGSAIFGGFYALGMGALNGGQSSLTGAYDPAEASTYPQGYREWSMAVSDPASGNTYYVPFQNFGPAGVPMAMAAIMSDAHRHDKTLLDQGEMAKASTAIGQYILDNTFLQGLSDTVNVLHDPSRYGPQFVQGLVASYGPYSAMGRQVQRALGNASRNPHDGFQGLVDAMAANYPGVSSLVPEATTSLGEPRTQGISGAAAFALPIRADISRDEPTLQILRDNSIAIPSEPKALNVIGGSIPLTTDEQDQIKRARGAAIVQGVGAISNTAAYQRADISLRNEMLKREINFDSQRVNNQFLQQLGREQILARRQAKAVPEPYYLAGVDNG